MDDALYIRTSLSENIKLEPQYIGSKEEILRRLKSRVEGVCTRHGYVMRDSVEISRISSGTVEEIGFSGMVVYAVDFAADVCNPLVGSVIRCEVDGLNSFAIRARVDPLLIIVAKEIVSVPSEVDLSTIAIGDIIFVEVVKKKYGMNSSSINIYGKVVHPPASTKRTNNTVAYDAVGVTRFHATDEGEEAEEERDDGVDGQGDDEDDDDDEDEDEEGDAEDDGDGDGDGGDDSEQDDINSDDEDFGSNPNDARKDKMIKSTKASVNFFDSDDGHEDAEDEGPGVLEEDASEDGSF